MKNPHTFIAIVDSMVDLRVSDYNTPEIRVTIGVLDPKDGKPRNWGQSSHTEAGVFDAGGCFATLYAGTYGLYFSHYGPACSHADLQHYEHGIRALKTISKRLGEMWKTRGSAPDAAVELGQWLEACGVSRVFMRPEGERRDQWLTDGTWKELTIASLIAETRRHFPEAVEQRRLTAKDAARSPIIATA